MEQEENLNNRLRLIAKLRALIDDQHTYPKLQLLREMEKEWARYEPVPPSRQRELQHGFFLLPGSFTRKESSLWRQRTSTRRGYLSERRLCLKSWRRCCRKSPCCGLQGVPRTLFGLRAHEVCA